MSEKDKGYRRVLKTVYGHCQKEPFNTPEEANHVGKSTYRKSKCKLGHYLCNICGFYHVTSKKLLKHERKRMREIKHARNSN